MLQALLPQVRELQWSAEEMARMLLMELPQVYPVRDLQAPPDPPHSARRLARSTSRGIASSHSQEGAERSCEETDPKTTAMPKSSVVWCPVGAKSTPSAL